MPVNLEEKQARMKERQRRARIRAKGCRIARTPVLPVIPPKTWLEQVLEYIPPKVGRPPVR